MKKSYFHLQLCYREWVIWGYGPRYQTVDHIYPANIPVKTQIPGDSDFSFDIPFRLPEKIKGLGDPVVYEKKTCWGYTFRSDDLCHSIGWDLYNSKEEAIETARKWAKEEDDRHRGAVKYSGMSMSAALEDIREYTCFFD